MMNIARRLLIINFVCLCSMSAHGGTVVCDGKVVTLAYHASNTLRIKLDSMNDSVFFCNPDSEWSVAGTTYVTGPNTCKTMYSTFLAAKMADKPLSNVYFDGVQVPASCDGWGNWSNANIRYYELNN